MPTKEAKKKPGVALVKWSEKLAAMAKATVQVEAGTGGEGNFIGTRGGFSYQGAKVPGNKMAVIVLDHVLENAWREGKFDADNPKSPQCYAFGRDVDELKPHEKAPKPQSPTCAECPKNQFGSAEQGRGMECSTNRRRLALIPATALKDGIAKAEVAYVSLSYFSGKAWKGYVREIESTLHVPPMAVVTEMAWVPDEKSQFLITFTLDEPITDEEHFEALFAKHEQVAKGIDFPYPQFDNDKAPAKGGGAAKKGAPAKKSKY